MGERRRSAVGVALASAAIAVALLGLASPAPAAFPGNNGLIAVTSTTAQVSRMNADGSAKEILAVNARSPVWASNGQKIAYLGPQNDDISTMNPDGSGKTVVCNCAPLAGDNSETRLAWSPDGSMFAFHAPAFSAASDIYRVNADGTGLVVLTATGDNTHPSWSPDGTKIAFSAFDRSPPGIWVMNADGTDQHGLNTGSSTGFPAWSPDGTKIAYARFGTGAGISVMNADGSGQTPVITEPSVLDVEWSPDGTKLVYDGDSGITVVNADGTGGTVVSSGRAPDWQPVPPGYARPKGATPLRASLVPSFAACTAPNREHGPPLAFGSCAPPQRSSANLTVGTPDANAQPANSTGFLAAEVVAGNPATQADEADVTLRLSLSDVRSAGDLSDYTGEVRAEVALRMTDRDNMPFASTTGTVTDQLLSFDAACISTPGPEGANCAVQTSADALVAGWVKEGRRTIWQLGQARLLDGGPDGDTATNDNTLFAVSGVFIP